MTDVAKGDSLKLPKKLIVLCDGTWQNSEDGWEKDGFFDKGHPQIPTNVTRIARAIKPENSHRHPQVVYYQAGVGSSSWSVYDQLLGGALAYGLSENVREAYSFLVDNYLYDAVDKVQDEIYLLGFSRGAFTARSIGGMITTLGLLEKHAMDYFYYIFEDFENAGLKTYKPKLPAAYKGTEPFNFNVDPMNITEYLAAYRDELVRLNLTRIVDIEAIAVWDTVGTLGLPIQPWLQKLGLPNTIHKYRFYDTGLSKTVKHAFHALALDEDRSAFQATVWEKEADNDVTELKQVWFPGAHSNIGGGYIDTSTSDITLAWIMSELSKLIEFNENYLLDQVAANKALNYPPDKSGKSTWQWGLGTVYESLTFPTSMAGSTLRTPDRYHRLVYQTGKPTPDLLRETNEYVHASARARYLFGVDAHNKPYKNSAVLKGWSLGTKKNADGKEVPAWTYGGDDKQCDNRQMEEATLSELELKLLSADSEMQAKLFPTTE